MRLRLFEVLLPLVSFMQRTVRFYGFGPEPSSPLQLQPRADGKWTSIRENKRADLLKVLQFWSAQDIADLLQKDVSAQEKYSELGMNEAEFEAALREQLRFVRSLEASREKIYRRRVLTGIYITAIAGWLSAILLVT